MRPVAGRRAVAALGTTVALTTLQAGCSPAPERSAGTALVAVESFVPEWVAEAPDPAAAPRVRIPLDGRWHRLTHSEPRPAVSASAGAALWGADLVEAPAPLKFARVGVHARLTGPGPLVAVPVSRAGAGLAPGEWTLESGEHRSVEDAWVAVGQTRGFRLDLPPGPHTVHVVVAPGPQARAGARARVWLGGASPRRVAVSGRRDAARVPVDLPTRADGGRLRVDSGGAVHVLGFVVRRRPRVVVATRAGERPPTGLFLEYAPAPEGEALALAWERGQSPAVAAAVAEGRPQVVVAHLAGSSRRALLAPAPSRLSLPVVVPAAGVLDVGLGMLPGAWQAAAVFSVGVVADGSRTRAFERRLEPASDPPQRGWVDVRVDLAAWAGRAVRLELEARPVERERLDAVAWANPVVHAASAASPRGRVSFVVVSADTVRADHTSAYGYARRTTPHLERFAAGATRFETCLAAANWTLPSHVSLFTSLLPSRHGVVRKEQRVAEPGPFVTRRLARAGWLSAGFTGGGYVGGAYGFDGGFHRYDDGRRYLSETVPDALAWLARYGDVPSFVFVHGFDAHHPVNPEGLAGAPDWPAGPPVGERELDPDDYDRGIWAADAAFGELLAGLERLGLAERTVVVFLSDHGEQFGEHGQWGHARGLYPEETRVPLVIRVPGRPGRVEAAPVSLVDVAPTLLALAGLEPDQEPAGSDLSGLLGGPGEGPAAPADERPLFSQSWDWGAVRFGEWALVRPGDGGAELYRPGADPRFVTDVSGAHPEEVALGLRLLEAAATSPEVGLAEDHDLDPETTRRLQALGYVQ